MNLNILKAHNALTTIQFNGGNRSKYEALKKAMKHLTEEDWETIEVELPDDYLMLRAWKHINEKKEGGEKECKKTQLSIWNKN